ncbi:hypothetical protein BAZ12_01330 [Elizabethkingia miricola]|uniref:HTH araC/xylS-type domain-containing protein n=1 Tax=Elizabethkingia miricola TaxID=172045 RepID=A0ABD4DLK2_ELIMR|nr:MULTISPECIES: helix-turn-helix domain-containing protein [Elizabethkingia]KUY17540.1 hypothetical protein ATB95_14465 [Elizabethkingia miricola]MCL1652687.1 AraC family transcriptional regulator [Elizabethkingia miricola]MDX8572767.1 helix-turn-helix domain-containing protein [Elizabethkingia sp. HX QKY]OPC11615.1 hypothetical protein BAY01_11285 [Elizabethkingia miricola]OPC68597.1 hypothetical protein BAZ13_14385 [Elizabethkingia miricola]
MKNKTNINVYNEKESFKNSIIDNFYISYYKDKKENINRIDNHQHTYYEIIFIENGKGIHTIDFKNYEFSGPCLFLLHPKNVHRIYKEAPTSGGVIKFNDNFFVNEDVNSKFLLKYRVFDDIDVQPVINLSLEDGAEILEFIELIRNQANSEKCFSANIVMNLLKSFLLKIYQIKKNSCLIGDISDHRFLRFKQFQELLESNLTQHHDLNFYAQKLNISTKTLSNICKLISHKTTQLLIKERILLEAKRMLIYTDLSVKEVAYELGFNDHAYFTRFFTSNVLLNPSDFKKLNT